MTDSKIAQFEVSDEDLLGYSTDDVACISCRPLCTNKIMRRYNGGPLFMCTRKEATKEFLAAEMARNQAAGVSTAPGHLPPPGQVLPPGQVRRPGA